MTREVVGSMSDWSGVLKDELRQINDGSLTLEQLIAVTEHRNPFEDLASRIKTQIKRQKICCKKYLPKEMLCGLDLDFDKVKIQNYNLGFDRLLIIPRGFTSNPGFDACVRQFPAWRYADDLDKAVPHDDRNARNDSYAVWFRDRQEADEELKNLSANRLAEQGILGITLPERLWYEMVYWDETGEHLDIFNWTLCSGSRDSDGSVPYVSRCRGRLRVCWDYPDARRGSLRARAAVSCLPKAD